MRRQDIGIMLDSVCLCGFDRGVPLSLNVATVDAALDAGGVNA